MKRVPLAFPLLLALTVAAASCTPSRLSNPTPTKPASGTSGTAAWTPSGNVAPATAAGLVTTGTPGARAAAAGTPAAPAKALDYPGLLSELKAAGASVEEAATVSGSVFMGNGRLIKVNGAEVQAFQYADEESARTDASRVSADGYKVSSTSVDWVAPPHFFRQGRLLVLYAGSNEQVLGLLEKLLGPQFAGAGAAVAVASANTPTAAAIAGATATATAAPTKVATPCTDKAHWLQDVTIPDNSVIRAGESFVKTWRLRNAGTCTWTTDYALVFAKGDRMGAPESIDFPSDVAPGGSIDLSVTLTAPASGQPKSQWQLADASGKTFGIDNSPDGTFWALIRVR